MHRNQNEQSAPETLPQILEAGNGIAADNTETVLIEVLGEPEIKPVFKTEANLIIETREPFGAFLLVESDGTFTGIDNTMGNAFVENFPTKEMAINWLNNPMVEPYKPLTVAQQNFIALEKRKADYKQFLDELTVATKAVVSEIGVDQYFQDDEGTVYKTFIQEGKFVYFEPVAVKRTRRIGEPSSGSNLSIKEATEVGFVVPKS